MLTCLLKCRASAAHSLNVSTLQNCSGHQQPGTGLQDLLARLRPTLERLTEYEQAAQAVAAIEASETRTVAAGPAALGAIEEEDSDTDESQNGSDSDSNAHGEPAGQTHCMPAYMSAWI